MPLISVLMPVYNGEKYLAESIKSILAQTFSDFEFIIINDGSTDKTKEIINSFADGRIKYIENKKKLGIARSLNCGLRSAQGKYVARQDADDISLPQRLEKQFNYLEVNKSVALVGSWIEFFSDLANNLPRSAVWQCPQGSGYIEYLLHYGNQLAHSAIFFRRQAILALGGYNERIEFAQDYELYCRLVDKYKLDNIGQILVKYRMHKDSISFNAATKNQQAEWAKKINYNFLKKRFRITPKEHQNFYQVFILGHKVGFKSALPLLKINKQIFNYYQAQKFIPFTEQQKIKISYRSWQKMLFKKAIKNLWPL